MKRTLIFIALLTVGGLFTAMAGPAGKSSILKFGLYNDRPFTYSINGQHHAHPVREARLQDIAPGNHDLIVYGPASCGHAPGSCGVSCGRSILFRGNIRVKPHTIMSGEVSRHGEFFITRVSHRKNHNGGHYNPAVNGGNNGYGNGGNNGNGYGNGGSHGHTHGPSCGSSCGNGSGYGNNGGSCGIGYGSSNGNGYGSGYGVASCGHNGCSAGNCLQSCSNVCGNTCTGACGGNQYYGSYDGYHASGNATISNGNFRDLLRTLDQQRFDSSRMIVAKEAVSRNSLTSSQVKEIASRFRHDSDRLEIAKFAFRNTIDKQNYFVVNQVFRYSSSVDALNRYIRA